MSVIENLDRYPYSNRHGSYGGMAGDKDGILIDNEYWIVKYPKSTKSFKNSESLDPYTTAPLSEYVGSKIYKILGFDVHETKLGIRNNKVVVACKDFCRNRGQLSEIRTIKNGAYRELSELLETQLHSSATGDLVNLQELLLHIEHNPLLKTTLGVSERFWEQAVVDIFIENNDRNNGNWGLLFDEETGNYSLAPVYDNGNAFMNKTSEAQIETFLNNPDKLLQSATGARTSFEYNNHILSAKKFLKLQNEGLSKALIKMVPIITEKMGDICKMITDIPETAEGHIVFSNNRKTCYANCLLYRLQHLLVPAYNAALQSRNNGISEESAMSEEAPIISPRI